MKKFLAILMVGFLSCNGALAGTNVVSYNNAGAVTTVAYAHSPYNFGSNAIYTPANRIRAGRRIRQIQYEKAVIHSIKNRNNINLNINRDNGRISQAASTPVETSAPMSRFSKDYTLKPQKTYTRGGVTYYN